MIFNKRVILITSMLFILLGCQKNNHTAPIHIEPQSYTIELKGGGSQIDSIGKTLKDSIIVKVNQPGSLLNKYIVRFFQATLCNDDSVTEKSVTNGSKVSYIWRLSSKAGVQTLRVTILDAARKNVDSLTITATALAPAKGWHRSSCLVANNFLNSVSKMSTGRIVASFASDNVPIYSDDNGISWHRMNTFNQISQTRKIVISPQDEIFVGTILNGIYYSPDQGKTWENRSYGIPPRDSTE